MAARVESAKRLRDLLRLSAGAWRTIAGNSQPPPKKPRRLPSRPEESNQHVQLFAMAGTGREESRLIYSSRNSSGKFTVEMLNQPVSALDHLLGFENR
jgi:hypothetical protein